MKTQIKEKGPIQLVGHKEAIISNQDCPLVWKNYLSNHTPTGPLYGIVYEEGFETMYCVGEKTTNTPTTTIPKGKYLIITTKGDVTTSIPSAMRYAHGVYLPQHHLKAKFTPVVEYYPEGDPHNPNYEMEVWIALQD